MAQKHSLAAFYPSRLAGRRLHLPGPGSGKAKAAPAGFYPNPVLNTLTYEVPSGVKAHRLTVLDPAGRPVLAQTFEGVGEQHTVDISTLKTGLYVVRLAGTNFHSEFKISKH